VFFRQVLHEDLGCASYVIADGGQAAVIDPKWEVEDYLALADEHGFQIRHILETHNHADHVSGKGRLQKATGAPIHVPAEAGVAFRHEPMADGDSVSVGKVRIAALATPGHRPEHTAYVVSDTARGGDAWLVVTGDSLFVGDVARPDLAVEPAEGARELFGSLNRLLELDDFAEAWPGHIGGSLCGGAGMSEKPGTTIGFERRFNRLLGLEDQDFVRELTAHLAPQPPNFKRIVELNRGPLLTEAAVLDPLAPARVKELMDEGVLLLDGRAPREFDGEHVPGSVNVTMTRSSVGTRAAWIADPERQVALVAATDSEARLFGRLLEAVGFRKLAGFLAGGTTAWREAGFGTGSTVALDVPGLAEQIRNGEVRVLDVRDDEEWEESHVPGSLHVPFHQLRDGVPAELENGGKPLAIVCSAGNRSSIAASLLKRAGFESVEHVADGGVADLENEGIELVEGK
jgi:glyoxylase-like metal-dependent hydrolase (beta-lactamase superfamily II)